MSEQSDEKLEVLVIDDDRSDGKLIRRYMEQIEKWCVDLNQCVTAEDGMEVLQEKEVDLVFLDYRLPDGKGTEVLREMQLDNFANALEVPIVLLSGQGSEEIAAEALRLGADDYRTKEELDPETLRESVTFVQRKQSFEQKIYEQARRDDLTKLFTRQYILNQLQEELERAVRYDRTVCFAMVDLDGFSTVNDQLGHLAGDQILTQTADVIRGQIRSSDLAGRYGGDEFSLLLPETDSDEAMTLARRLLVQICEQDYEPLENEPINLTACVGIAEFDGEIRDEMDHQQVESLIRWADRAMYRAKESGGGAVERRREERRPVQSIPVQVFHEDESYQGELKDHSPGGVRLQVEHGIAPGRQVTLNIESDSDLIETEGTVRWCQELDHRDRATVGLQVENWNPDRLK